MLKQLPDTARPAAPVLASSTVAELSAQQQRADGATEVLRLKAVAVFFVAIGLYTVLLWVRRRSLWPDLFSGLGTIFLALQPLANALGFAGKVGASVFLAGGMAPGWFGACWFVTFMLLMRPGQLLRPVVVLAAWSALTATIFAVVAVLHVAVPLWPLLFMANLLPNLIAGFIVVGVLVLPPAWRGDPVARLLLIGYVTGFVGAVVQNVPINGVVGGVHVFGIQAVIAGFMGFAVGQALALARSYSQTLNDLDRRNRDLADVNLSMARFLPDAFLALLSRGSVKDVVRGDNTELEISVLFSDIRGFTGLSEKLGTRKVFELINKYLEHVEPTIHGNRGFISQYYGDGVMALFASGDHGGVDDAVASAAAMHHAVARFNETRAAAHEEPLIIGVGLNTGTLMLGTIGGKDRLACNVIGDPVNLAARIEALTRHYGLDILVGEATRAACDAQAGAAGGEPLAWLEVDRVRVKGKTAGVTLFTPVPASLARTALFAAESRLWRLACDACRLQDWPRAEAALGELAGAHPQSGFSSLYARARLRVQRYQTHPPPPDWDGVHDFEAT